MRKEVIIDIKSGNVTGIEKNDTIILKGDYLDEDSSYVENAIIVIKDEDDKEIEYPLKFEGYNLKLFIDNFISDKKDNILITGEPNALEGYITISIYEYDRGSLKEIFNILKQCISSEEESIRSSYKLNILKEQILNKLPQDSSLINFNRFGGENGIITKDIDCDGIEEILCGYKLKDNQYLAVFRELDGTLRLIDTIEGDGYDISDLLLDKVKIKSNNILVGWKVGSIWSVLDILEFRNNKFNKLLKGDKINFSKIELVNIEDRRDGMKNIVLWSHESGEAYKVQMYSFRGDIFEKTFKYDKDYFGKVEEYYISLINRTRETPQYLYFLIDAQYRAGNRKEALLNLNKALKHPKPYPSIEALKKLKKRMNG